MIYGGLFDIDNKIKREDEINKLMLDPLFWDNRDEADKLVREFKELKDITSKTIELNNRIKDICDVLSEANLDNELLILSSEEINHPTFAVGFIQNYYLSLMW